MIDCTCDVQRWLVIAWAILTPLVVWVVWRGVKRMIAEQIEQERMRLSIAVLRASRRQGYATFGVAVLYDIFGRTEADRLRGESSEEAE